MDETNWRHAYNIAETFWIEGRGLIILSDVPMRELPEWLALKINDPIRLVRPDKSALETVVRGIEMLYGNRPMPLSIMLPAERRSDVPAGSQVWVTPASVRLTAATAMDGPTLVERLAERERFRREILAAVAAHDGRWSWYQLARSVGIRYPHFSTLLMPTLSELEAGALLRSEPQADRPGQPRYWITNEGRHHLTGSD